MKKSAMLLAGLLLVSSLASAKVVGSAGNFVINSNDEVLTLKVNAKVREPLAAWWQEKGFFGSRTLVENMGTLSIGESLPPIATKEIYVIAPYSTGGGSNNNIQAQMSVSPNMVLTHSSGPETIAIPITLKDQNGSATGDTILIDADSAGNDSLAVDEAVSATGLANLGNYVGGEIIDVMLDTAGLTAPLNPGSYSGSAQITVSLQP